MKPDDPKAKPPATKDNDVVIVPFIPLQIFAPAAGDTVSVNFAVDGVYSGGAGASLTVTLYYTSPSYATYFSHVTTTVLSDESWTVMFSGVTADATRRYKAIATASSHSASVENITVMANRKVILADADSGPFSEP